MSIQQSEITLYIHPDKGPIMPMQLDMLKIEISIVHSPMQANRDDARVRAIAASIRVKFPNVEPDGKLEELRSLVSRLVHASIFDGVVLRLPGFIDGSPLPRNPSAEEVDKLTKASNELKTQLDDLKQKYSSVQARIANLQGENTQLRDAHDIQRDEINHLREDWEKAARQAYDAGVEATRYKGQVSKLEQEKAALQVKLDKAEQDQQAFYDVQKDVATLRQQLDNARKSEKQLRTTIEEREKELSDLRLQIRRLAEGKASNKRDEAKDPWLD